MLPDLSPYAYPLTACAALLLLKWLRYRHNPKHIFRVMSAKRTLDKLAKIDAAGAKMAYLRKVHHFTFEEVVLEALRRRGHQIKRNKRYTGDGGIDGQCWLQGRHTLIQSKRYKNHISAQHIRDFQQIVEGKSCHGLFVHTGKTGKASVELAGNDPNITIISGDKLLKLLEPPKR